MKVIDKIKKLHCLFLFQGKHHNVINDQEMSLEKLVVFNKRRPGHIFHNKGFIDLFHGPEVGLISHLQGIKTETSSDICFCNSGRPHQHNIKVLFKPLAFSQLAELLFADAIHKRVIIMVQVVING